MSTTTPINGFQIPQLGDSPNIETAIHPMATAIDTRVVARFASAAARNAAISAPTAGMVTYRTDQSALEYYSGADWVILNGAETGVSALAVSSGTDTTTSASYVNLAGTGSSTSFSFTKKSAGSRLRVELQMSAFSATAGTTQSVLGVNINSTDYDITVFHFNAVNEHHQIAGSRIITGVAAGVYTVQGRWKRGGGAGTLTRDVADWYSLTCKEIA